MTQAKVKINMLRMIALFSIRRGAGFWLLQVVLISAGVAWASYYAVDRPAHRTRPPLRQMPLVIEPKYDEPAVISDQRLREVLRKLVLRRGTEATKINHVDHALRLWGIEAEFDDAGALSGREMRSLLLDHRQFAEDFGHETPPLLIDTESGVRVRMQEGHASSSHRDHTLACLAEVATPVDFEVWTPQGPATLRSMLEHSLDSFRLNQQEYEWSALAYVLYLPPLRGWVTREGQEITFDRLAERIMREELTRGVCVANHRMHALVAILRVDDQMPIIADATRSRVLAYLAGVTSRLVATQHEEGYWDVDWAEPSAGEKSAERAVTGGLVGDRILATGHPMEWWALAPKEVLPPREVLIAAGKWLGDTILGLSDDEVTSYYTYLSHAGRALSLWRGRFPAQVDLKDSAQQQQLTGGQSRLDRADSALTPTPWIVRTRSLLLTESRVDVQQTKHSLTPSRSGARREEDVLKSQVTNTPRVGTVVRRAGAGSPQNGTPSAYL